ncbi:MAG: ABC transporter permease subunit [Firmicutes bacterium]|nr:ABC transporter permease subunit [Bacillota bacterium]
MNSLKPKNKILILMLLPGIAVFTFAVIFPLLMAVKYSFFQWSGGPEMNFTGLRNYLYLFKDKYFWASFKNNLVIVVLSIFGQVGIGFLLAVLINSKILKFKKFHRTVIFFPVVLSAVVIGFLWTMIYSRQYGLLNWLLNKLQLESLIRYWLDDPGIVLYTVSIPLIWQYIGLYLVIFLSAMQGVPRDIYEVAEIDGGSISKRLFFVVLPMCKPVISTALILSFLSTWNEFPFALILIRTKALKTIPLWLTNFNGRYSTDYTQLMAALVVASIPVIIVYLIFSKQVVQGMTAGAVKG